MYSTLYHTVVVGLMAVCETHPLLSLPRSPFAQREQWLNPVIVRLVSLRRVTNIVWSERPACTSHHQKCKDCARNCVHLARATSICISGFSQLRLLSRTVVAPVEVASVINLLEASGWVAAGLFMTEG